VLSLGPVRAGSGATTVLRHGDRDFLSAVAQPGWRWPSDKRDCCSRENGGPPWPSRPAAAQQAAPSWTGGRWAWPVRARQTAGGPTARGIRRGRGRGTWTRHLACKRAGSESGHRRRRGPRAPGRPRYGPRPCAPGAGARTFGTGDGTRPTGRFLRQRSTSGCQHAQPAKGHAGGHSMHPTRPTVSCTILVYEAWSRTLSFANAGHDAPLLIRRRATGVSGRAGAGSTKGRAARGARKGLPALPTFTGRRPVLLPAGFGSSAVHRRGCPNRRHRPKGNWGPYPKGDDARLGWAAQEVRRVAHGRPPRRGLIAKRGGGGARGHRPRHGHRWRSALLHRVDLASGDLPTIPRRANKVSRKERRLAGGPVPVGVGWGMEGRGQVRADPACWCPRLVTNVVLQPARRGAPARGLTLGVGRRGPPSGRPGWSRDGAPSRSAGPREAGRGGQQDIHLR